ncbi:MAG: MarR family transcriptional regulator [Syntrophobacteraceae bacterium]|jgi:predicted transcriptional regulator
MSRDFKVKIETEEEFFAGLIAQAEKIDRGVIPDKPIERVSFSDLGTFYRCCTPKRLQLLQELHKIGCVSISALARHLHRDYKNVFRDVKALEAAGLVEKTDKDLYCVPWDEFTATVKLAS